ncbi:bifunctional DNA primase/polymerase [Streptomyces sp. KMM 9044]|uniref:bifunctional DNA primase/polymerase n=1 Tax=Streptomyces sp. KMM 9044 TaxID=2744474 RepID=UPI0021510D56|nr:bifunctional DNA primase/polymerase [Streptomyces sp. KMM 9044]WAX82209.1 bifunctional DNA primase/polymerase [Streptomyces sp. KMM 9044]
MVPGLRGSHSRTTWQASAGRSLAIARWCAGRGWPVHPLAPGRKTPAGNCDACRAPGHTHRGCGCQAAGRWCHGFHAATLDLALIERWWGANPGLGVGIACGPAGLVVLDIDAHERRLPRPEGLLPGIEISASIDLTGLANGFHTIGVLAALRASPSPADDETTLRVRTPSGGLHVWYRAHHGHRWQCSTGSGGRALAWQVDVRAHGGYIVAPGTVTEAGAYEAVGVVRHPAPLPGWLAEELKRTGHLPPVQGRASRPVPSRARQAVLAAGGSHETASRVLAPLLGEVAACAVVPEGAAFSEKLNRAAYTAGGLVSGGRLGADEAERVLREIAEQARPGQERRCAAIIRSGLDAGLRRPLSPGGRA